MIVFDDILKYYHSTLLSYENTTIRAPFTWRPKSWSSSLKHSITGIFGAYCCELQLTFPSFYLFQLIGKTLPSRDFLFSFYLWRNYMGTELKLQGREYWVSRLRNNYFAYTRSELWRFRHSPILALPTAYFLAWRVPNCAKIDYPPVDGGP